MQVRATIPAIPPARMYSRIFFSGFPILAVALAIGCLKKLFVRLEPCTAHVYCELFWNGLCDLLNGKQEYAVSPRLALESHVNQFPKL